MGSLMPKPSLLKNSGGTIQTKTGFEDKGVYTFLKGISSKVNAIAWLEFELQSSTLAILLCLKRKLHLGELKWT